MQVRTWLIPIAAVPMLCLATSSCRPTVGAECLNRMSECVRLCAPEEPSADKTPMPTVWVDQRRECERRCMDLCAPEAPPADPVPPDPLP